MLVELENGPRPLDGPRLPRAARQGQEESAKEEAELRVSREKLEEFFFLGGWVFFYYFFFWGGNSGNVQDISMGFLRFS